MSYYVYILSSRSRTLYIGVTNDLHRRVLEHKTKAIRGFTSKYNVDSLVHFEETGRVEDAIAREKQLKGWTRAKKLALIDANNTDWLDLSNGWYPNDSLSS